MGNSTVFSFKADTKDFDAKLDGLKASAEATFLALEQSTKKAQKAQNSLDQSTKVFAQSLRKTKSEIERLNAEKKKNGTLSKQQSEKLDKLIAKQKQQERAYNAATRALKAKVVQTKRAIATQKASAGAYDTIINRIKKETAARKVNASGLRKENAERRAMGTSLVRHIRRLESLAVAYFAVTTAYRNTLGAGVELNRQYENMELGLAALISAKTDSADATGKETDSLTKFLVAQQQTKEVLADIRREATETPATFTQMVGFYQQAIGHALAAGQSFGANLAEISDNTILLTKRMSSLGSSVGMSMDLIDEEIRSLMSGDVSRDSKLALILFGSPTKANAAIKEAKKQANGLAELFNEKLVPFEVLENIETFDKNLNKLVAEIQITQMAASEPIFDDMAASFKNLTVFLQEDGANISETFVDMYNTIKISFLGLNLILGETTKTFVAIAKPLDGLVTDFNAIEDSSVGVVAFFGSVNASLENTALLLENAGIGFASFINYFKLSSEEYAKYSENAEKEVQANRLRIKTLKEIGEAGLSAGKKLRESFRVSKLDAGFDKIMLDKDGSTANVNQAVDRINTIYAHLTATEAKGSEASIKLAKDRDKALERLGNEWLATSIQLKLKEVDVADSLSSKEKNAAKKLAAKKIEIANMAQTVYLDGEAKAQVILFQKYEADLVKYKDVIGAKLTLDAKYNQESKALSDKFEKKDIQGELQQTRKAFEAEQTLRKLSINLISDEREKKLALAELAHQDRLEEIEYRSQLEDWTKDYYDERRRLEEEAHKKLLEGYGITATIMRNATNTMSTGLEEFFDIASDGFLDFGDLAQDVLKQILDDLIKLTLVQPLVSSITGNIGGGSGGDTALYSTLGSMFFAQGGAVSSPSLSAHSNSIVSQPTPFLFANGGAFGSNVGVMGEVPNKSEAILPLAKMSSGNLGVEANVGGNKVPNVIINIENNSGQEIEQETTSSFDGKTYIINTMISAISRNTNGTRDMIRGIK